MGLRSLRDPGAKFRGSRSAHLALGLTGEFVRGMTRARGSPQGESELLVEARSEETRVVFWQAVPSARGGTVRRSSTEMTRGGQSGFELGSETVSQIPTSALLRRAPMGDTG